MTHVPPSRVIQTCSQLILQTDKGSHCHLSATTAEICAVFITPGPQKVCFSMGRPVVYRS